MRLSAVALALALLLASAASAMAQERTVTLDEAVHAALAKSPQLRAAQKAALAAQYDIEGTPGWPALAAALSPTIAGESKDALTLSQGLSGWGQLRARQEMARQQAEQSRFAAIRRAQEVRHAVSLAYMALQAAEAEEHVQAQAVELAKRFLTTAEFQYEAGNVPEANVLRARIELADATQALARATSARETRQAILARWLGSKGPPPLATALAHAAEPPPLDASLRLAESARPELHEATAALESAKAAVELARSRWWPDVMANAWIDDQRDPLGTAGAGLSIGVSPWAYGNMAAQTRSAELRSAAAQSAIEAQRQQIAIEVQSAHQAWSQARRQASAIATTVIAPSERLLDMAQEGFRLGASSYLDVLEAQRTLLNARRSEIAALKDENTAAADLWLAVGNPAEEDSLK